MFDQKILAYDQQEVLENEKKNDKQLSRTKSPRITEVNFALPLPRRYFNNDVLPFIS